MMKKNFNHLHLNKIKINIHDNSYWVVPDIFKLFSPRRSDFIVRKAKTIEEIWKFNHLEVGNYYISFNRDYQYKNFNELQKLSALKDLRIDKKVEQEIANKGYYIFEYQPDIHIKLSEKSLYKIYSGNSFLINEDYFKDYVEYLKERGIKKDKWVFIWTGSKFNLDSY